ncbi:PIN domain nuclease [Sulfolobales archaeon HS-7]|nr:PIN domain nuclease [Sulfolobales archaeon HS-7]
MDTSALYPILNYVDKIDVNNVYILTLTFYEVGNVIWKEYYMHKRIKDPVSVAKLFQKFMRELKVLEDPPLEEVMKVASERGLTFYDAAYVYSAESKGLVLVSEDRELIRKANAIPLKEIMK